MYFKDLFRDINSYVHGLNIDTSEILSQDVIVAINDAIKTTRTEYIQNGLGHLFSVTERHESASRDANYPFTFSTRLRKRIFQSGPIESSILASNFIRTKNTIQNTLQTFPNGTQAEKDGVLYQAVAALSSVNAFVLTFEVEGIRNFTPNNGMTYAVGDIVYDQVGRNYYRCTTEYLNTSEDAISTLTGSFLQLYWKKLGKAYLQAGFVPFDRIHELKLSENYSYHRPFTIKDRTLYLSVGNLPFVLTYIPEWEDILDPESDIEIPDTMERDVKNQAIRLLGVKLGVNTQDSNEQ